MTITFNTVKEHGSSKAADAVVNIGHIAATLHTDISGEIESEVEDLCHESQYEVIYYHEAIDIVTGSDFEPSETPEFSGCQTALDCVMLEANLSTGAASDEGWRETIDAVKEATEELYNKALEEGYEEFKIEFSLANTVHGWESHDYETESGLCVWEALEGECFALEITVEGVTIHMCCNHSSKAEQC